MSKRVRFYLFTLPIILLVVIVACKEDKYYKYTHDEKVEVMLSRADVNINNRANVSDDNIENDIINTVEEPILIHNQEYHIPKEYIKELNLYLDKNIQKVSQENYSAFLKKYEEGKEILQRHKDNNLKNLNQDDRTVLYYIAKSALKNLNLDLTYDIITGQIYVADETGIVVYENQSYTENTSIDYSFMAIVMITIVALYALYFVFIYIKRGNLHTTERVYEKVNI